MNEEQRAAFLIAQSAAAMIEAMAMASTNQHRAFDNEPPAYERGAFLDLIDRYGIGHNAAVSWLTGQ